MHFTRIIPYEKVCGMLPGSKLMKKLCVVQKPGKNNPALGAVHVGWCKKNWYNGGRLGENFDTLQSISREKYDTFIAHIERRISKEKGIIFLFAYNTKSALEWVRTLDTKATFVLIGTVKSNPVPSFPFHVTRELRWQMLALTMRNMGVSRLELAGETDLTVVTNSDIDGSITKIPNGCVNIAYDSLKSFLTVDKVKSLTFPNVYLDSCGNVLSEW